jgi:hypothetical protein
VPATSWRSVTGELAEGRRRERGVEGVVGDDRHGVDVGELVLARERGAAAFHAASTASLPATDAAWRPAATA